MADTQKIVNLGLIIIGSAVFLFLQKLTSAMWSLAGFPRVLDWLITPQSLVAFLITMGVIFYVRRHRTANAFLNESITELAKVTWPPNKETVISTGISCVLIVFCALILFLIDSLWGVVVHGLFSF